MENERSEHQKSMILDQVKDKIDKWFNEHTDEEVLEMLRKYKVLPNIDYESLYEELYRIECWCQQTRKKLVELSNSSQDLNTITDYLKTKCRNSNNTED